MHGTRLCSNTMTQVGECTHMVKLARAGSRHLLQWWQVPEWKAVWLW